MPSTRREQMKLETRQRVVDAARTLFAEKGYAAATIRDIAATAKVSTGSVFTTFDSKEAILSTIVLERQGELMQVIAAARATESGNARARLKGAFAAAYGYEFQRLLLVLEQIGASWSWSHEFEEANRKSIVRAFNFIREIVAEARAEGELLAQTDLDLLADLLLGAFLRNFRHAWFRQWSKSETVAYMDRQIDMIFDGACAGTMKRPEAARKKA